MIVVLKRQDGKPTEKRVFIRDYLSSEDVAGPKGIIWDRFNPQIWYVDDILDTEVEHEC